MKANVKNKSPRALVNFPVDLPAAETDLIDMKSNIVKKRQFQPCRSSYCRRHCTGSTVLGICLVLSSFLVLEISAQQHNSAKQDIGLDLLKLLNESIVDPNPSVREVCYKDVGCFNKDTGLMKHIGLLPLPPDILDTTFLLYKKDNQRKAIEINPDIPGTLKEVDKSLPVVIIIHGFASNASADYLVEVKDALLKKENVTVIMVDFTEGVKPPEYALATVTTELVGRQTGVLINAMMNHIKIPAENFHLVGFSLGAHVAGFAGKWLMTQYGVKIGRITGLDPASPLFEEFAESSHLNPNDAAFVDVIHASAGDSFVSGDVGFKKPVGHVDFYPNGGKDQPGCKLINVACSHQRSVRLFAASIKPGCNFVGYPCENYEKFKGGSCRTCGASGCGMMGYYSQQASGRGIFYLDTKGKRPYCLEEVVEPTENLSGSALTVHRLAGRLDILVTFSVILWTSVSRFLFQADT